MDNGVGAQLTALDGVVGAIHNSAGEITEVACLAWEFGKVQIESGVFDPQPTNQQAQALLNQMHAEVNAGSVAKLSVDVACDLAEIAGSGL